MADGKVTRCAILRSYVRTYSNEQHKASCDIWTKP